MFSLSNSLSFLRCPLAFLFLAESTTVRITAIILAMLTDSIDGYLARRFRSASRFGAILDPTMDKFFVFFVLGILLYEGNIDPWQASAMLSRDFFLCIFGVYLSLSGNWNAFEFKSIRWGKITTALQFLVLIGVTLHISISWAVYSLFVLFGMLAFIELWQSNFSATKRE